MYSESVCILEAGKGVRGEEKERTEAGSDALIPPSINDLFMRTQPIRRERKTKSILDCGME